MNVPEVFLDLVNKVAKGQISLDSAVAEIQSQRIKPWLEKEAVLNLEQTINSLANQSPPQAYYLATLNYESA
ncbi:MAG: hypothetical protein AB1422_15295, partial [bacterium]